MPAGVLDGRRQGLGSGLKGGDGRIVRGFQTRIDDATLKSPVLGRVLYRLAEPGEVLGAGGKALTLVNLEDVYMEIFLPAAEAAAVKVGAEGRLTVDYERTLLRVQAEYLQRLGALEEATQVLDAMNAMSSPGIRLTPTMPN